MNRNQLNLLVDLYNLLANLGKDHVFNILVYIGGTANTEKEAVKCGTNCCAMGWGSLCLKSWRKNGVTVKDGEIFINDNPLDSLHGANFFGITTSEYNYMFMPQGRNRTPTDVMKHIEQIINYYDWELY